MKPKQSALFGTAIFLTVSTILVGDFTIQQHFENRRRKTADEFGWMSGDRAGLGSKLTGGADGLSGENAHLFDGVPTQSADGLSEFDSHPAWSSIDRDGRRPHATLAIAAAVSKELRAQNHAASLGPANGSDDGVIRALIEEELSDATAEEREIWLAQLRGMQPKQMRDLLQIRWKFGSALPLRRLERPAGIVTVPEAKRTGG